VLKFSRLFKRAKKLGINVKLVILGLICVFVILPLVAFTVTMVSRPFQVVEKVTDPSRIIYTYEWFFNTYASAKSYATQLQTAHSAVDTFKADHAGNLESYQNSTELARLREVERGLNNQLVSTVNTYNANAENKTRAIFKDWDLPSSLALTPDNKLIRNN